MTNKLDGNLDIGIDSSLSKKVSKGALWVIATTIFGRGLGLIASIILARLLAPDDFGLMAIALAIIVFSHGTTQTGFESALIQKQDKPEDFLNTAWTFEFTRALILFFIIFFSAPLLASFFKEPRAVDVLRVISLSLVFQGLRNIGVVYFRKNLDFRKQFVLELTPIIVNICVIVPLAFYLRNVWALVWGSIATSITSCFVSYVMHPYRPRFDFNIKKAGNLFKFGKWILGASIIVMVRQQGMTMFVGKFLGIPMLGFYNRAGVFSASLFQQISEIVWKVGYPAYSQLQNDSERFKQAYLKTLKLLTFIGIPMAGGLFVLSGDFVHLFLTDKWLPIVPLIQILCLQAILNFINTPSSIVFQACGKPSIGTKISTLGLIILVIIVYPLSVRWGTSGAVAALLLGTLIPSPLVWYMTLKIMRCTFLEFLKPIALPLISTGIMSFAIISVKKYFAPEIGITGFFGFVIFGVFAYAIMTFIFEKCANYGIYGLIKERANILKV